MIAQKVKAAKAKVNILELLKKKLKCTLQRTAKSKTNRLLKLNKNNVQFKGHNGHNQENA